MLIGLLRHGEVAGSNVFRGHTDDPLTAGGLAQMQSRIGADHRWNRVVSSPLIRCAEFSHSLCLQHSLPLSYDPRLMELYFGSWEGYSAEEVMQQDAEALRLFWRDPLTHSPSGGESLQLFQSRVHAAMKSIADLYAGQRVLVVTHGGVIRLLLCAALNHPIQKVLELDVPLGSLHGLLLAADGTLAPALIDRLDTNNA